VTLPEGLRAAVESPVASVRFQAVFELERLLTSGSAGVARAAGQALERLRDDDSRRVAAAATTALHARSGVSPSGSQTPGQIPPPPSAVRSSHRRIQPPPLVDNDVRFTVYRPRILFPSRWASLLVFAHKTDVVADPDGRSIDPIQEVKARARAHFAGTAALQVVEDARRPLVRGGLLRIAPDLPGIECNPEAAEFEWWEPVHEVAFRLRAEPDLAGKSVRGAVRIWCGPLIIGELSIAIPVGEHDAATASPPVAESVRRYRRIFPSYSHHDSTVVEQFAVAAQALGDQYLQDVFTLRAGERWEPRLRELIEAADVFQLFWSRNSMHSPYCRQEWEHALALQRGLFVRPLYWEEPLPEDPGLQLPPAALRELHFVRLPAARREVDRPAPPPAPAAEPEPVPRQDTRRDAEDQARRDARSVSDVDDERARRPASEVSAAEQKPGERPRSAAPPRPAPWRRSHRGRRSVAIAAAVAAAGLFFSTFLRAGPALGPAGTRPPASTSPPTAANPSTSTSPSMSTGQKTVAVPGAQSWTDTGVHCRTGSVLEIEATGTIHYNRAASAGPNGDPNAALRRNNVSGLAGANHAGLIGSFDRRQPYFVVGSDAALECPTGGGNLFLGINDDYVDNNSGKFVATIKQR
jgi:hypothetical protein